MKISNAKFLRNTFFEGMKDTFNIVYGDHGISEKLNGYEYKFRFGILDVLIFPLIAYAMLEYGFPSVPLEGSLERVRTDDTKRGVFRVFIGVLGVVLELPRFIIALAVTVVLSVVVLAVHILKYPFSKYLEHQFYKLQGEEVTYIPGVPSSIHYQTTLGQFADDHNCTLNDLDVELTPTGARVKIDVEYRGMYTLYDARTHYQFFSRAAQTDEELRAQTDATNAGRLLGFTSGSH